MSERDIIDTIIAEAVGEGNAGMEAVAWTIMNRADIRDMTPDAVVRQPHQYTGYSNPGPAAQRAQQDPEVRARVERIWNDVSSGRVPDPTGGADHYHTKGVNPSWNRGYDETAVIGNHRFFNSGTRPSGNVAAQQPPNVATASPALRDAYNNRMASVELPRQRPATTQTSLGYAAQPQASAVSAINTAIGQPVDLVGNLRRQSTSGTASKFSASDMVRQNGTAQNNLQAATNAAAQRMAQQQIMGDTFGSLASNPPTDLSKLAAQAGAGQLREQALRPQYPNSTQLAAMDKIGGIGQALTTRPVQSVQIDPRTGMPAGSSPGLTQAGLQQYAQGYQFTPDRVAAAQAPKRSVSELAALYSSGWGNRPPANQPAAQSWQGGTVQTPTTLQPNAPGPNANKPVQDRLFAGDVTAGPTSGQNIADQRREQQGLRYPAGPTVTQVASLDPTIGAPLRQPGTMVPGVQQPQVRPQFVAPSPFAPDQQNKLSHPSTGASLGDLRDFRGVPRVEMPRPAPTYAPHPMPTIQRPTPTAVASSGMIAPTPANMSTFTQLKRDLNDYQNRPPAMSATANALMASSMQSPVVQTMPATVKALRAANDAQMGGGNVVVVRPTQQTVTTSYRPTSTSTGPKRSAVSLIEKNNGGGSYGYGSAN